ncbi:MAG: hypothetical protein ABL908_04495, partial [Hyphomicrobium sp.]
GFNWVVTRISAGIHQGQISEMLMATGGAGNWSDGVYRYCERGFDAAFWAEPFNAMSNAAFLLVAVAGAVHLARRPRVAGHPDHRAAEWALTGLVFAIGVGSFLFHTLAMRWASLADTAPIGLFMLGYFGYALRRLLGFGWVPAFLGVAGFVLALRYSGNIPCLPGLLPITRAGGHPCFNGSLGYIPALVALAAVGAALMLKRHAAGPWVLAAGAVFLVSLTFRTIDFEVCALSRVMGRVRGTHALWHLLNAATLHLLLTAAVRHGPLRTLKA